MCVARHCWPMGSSTSPLPLIKIKPAYAVNPNAPTITDLQLAQVLFRCTDQAGGIVGNSYCIVNCAVIGDDTVNDMCTM
ncbi:hypothetical protein TsFJ059_005403 [Trichoderma semiorbis]|uniref:Uncharacterized protein n=1 Tax=Trichoderma semiorbis TaxID=1491008 RepID=A0A9P8HVR1_9HYPO|nr:hypothetical protein TsFJ059_005403 [Trichoderma semiorbis]